ncbi:MAG: asparaginase domain-containing protein [Treponemataceae bacterium]|nr:asparaginase domain-containing protein [Treponemataceae bacterium]
MSGNRKAFIPDSSPAGYSIEDAVLSKVATLVRVLGSEWKENAVFERITGNFQIPANCSLTGLSLRIAEKGSLGIEFHSRKKKIAIEEIRIEEDAGRLTRTDGVTRMDYSHVGMPSVRIKTCDDFELGEEAYLFLDELRRLLQYLQLCPEASVESLVRCNAYVALAKYPCTPGYFVKLRNLNSFNFVRKAINSELTRQEEILMSGGIVLSESRLWNERNNCTESYKNRSSGVIRHFEPAVKPLCEGGKALVPTKDEGLLTFPAPVEYNSGDEVELPDERRRRFCSLYGLSRLRADFICDDKSRADFFEAAVKSGADPMATVHSMSSEILRILRKLGIKSGFGNLKPETFATVLNLFSAGKIHRGIVRQLLQTLVENGGEPETIIKKNSWYQISSEKELLPYVKAVVSENPQEAEKLRGGDMAPLEFLTGLVMKKTGGMANPVSVKTLLKNELDINIVYVLSTGGAMCGRRRDDGSIDANGEKVLEDLLSKASGGIRCQIVSLMHLLSEEMEPDDWAVLIAEIAARIAAGTANGIVVVHGTDTLPYTAALLFWLFSDAGVPLVLTASSKTPDVSDEAERNMALAMKTACNEKKGVYVAFGGKILSPLNLKFVKPAEDGFVNWNLPKLVFSSSGPIAFHFAGFTELDTFVLKQLLREAAGSMLICRVYPGLKAEYVASLIEGGVSNFILELYGTGTGSMRGSDYSLSPLLSRGRKRGCHFYCTSQQDCCINFSEYTTSRRVWREGAVPMGRLTTESVSALFFAASLTADTPEELEQFMEQYADLYR